jgi:Rad3-related DNA helicase
LNPNRIHDEFPAPGYRGNQRQALDDIREAFSGGADVVLVQAPTGSGKSLLARAIAGCANTSEETADADTPVDAFYTTPQVSQLDDVAEDDLLDDFQIVRGKNNYNCILPGHTDTPVGEAKCVRESGFNCGSKRNCPYFVDRAAAVDGRIAAMTLAYFMQTASSELFDERDVVVIDEAHGLIKWAEMYGTISISPRTVPMWDEISIPNIDTLEEAVNICSNLHSLTTRRLNALSDKPELNSEETAEREQIYRLRGNISWFTDDFDRNADDHEWVVDQSNETGAITIKPLNPQRYLKHTVWDRGNKFALLSATILNKDAFCRQMGVSPDDAELVRVPHTFPVEQRPLYDVTCGKMTKDEKNETLPKVGRTIAQVMKRHNDSKGIIHCHSYDIQSKLVAKVRELGFGSRVRDHQAENRDQALTDWKASSGNDVFFSVKMEEALDLEGDLARWQVLCKAPYLNAGDSRVNARLTDGRWNWYYRRALQTLIQACGRIIRTPDDYGATYIADSSIPDVFRDARHEMPPWFREQVDRCSTIDLPQLQLA